MYLEGDGVIFALLQAIRQKRFSSVGCEDHFCSIPMLTPFTDFAHLTNQ